MGRLGLPGNAVWMCFFPTQTNQVELLSHGGFLYFDKDKKLVAGARVAGQGVLKDSARKHLYFMEFKKPVSRHVAGLPPTLQEETRWHSVTLPELQLAGAEYYSWVGAGELSEGYGLGGFIYKGSWDPAQAVFFPM